MPEETTSSSAEPGRRRPAPASSENSGGGLKTVAVILAVVVAGLAFALYKRNSSAGVQSEADAKAIGSLSNQVTELRTKLALEHSNLQLAASNHQALLHRRTAELTATSNSFAKASLSLDVAREETRIAQAELSAKAGALAALEAQRVEWQLQAEAMLGLQLESGELKERLQQLQFAHAALQETLGRVRLDQTELERKLEDPAFLRLQARRAEDAAELRRRTAANQRIRSTDPRVQLDLQPDGSVRPAIIATEPRIQ